MPSNSYYYGSNRSSAMLNLKPPVKVRSDLTPDFLRKRIPEILGIEYTNIYRDFYNSIYHHFFSHVGYPVKEVFPLNTPHDKLKLGDVITIEEVGNYSRLYQKTNTDIGFLILEQSLDTTTNPDLNVWKTIIKSYPSQLEIYYKNSDVEGVLKLDDLKKEDAHLYHHFKEFIDTHKQMFAQCLIDKLPKEKAKVIHECNPDTPGMVNALWEDLLRTQLS
jgi:hypothetical protein